ncbi:MAG: preprotein translocase subunit SecG [Defluviitaleaceae bacterium]|nr:preprotein translocase subunit SecG [Defluviitaleaceae bacterium]
MSTIYIILTAVLGLACTVLVMVVLMQSKRDAGFSGQSMDSSSSERTYFDKNKSRTKEGKQEIYTKVLAAVFMSMSLIVGFLA